MLTPSPSSTHAARHSHTAPPGPATARGPALLAPRVRALTKSSDNAPVYTPLTHLLARTAEPGAPTRPGSVSRPPGSSFTHTRPTSKSTVPQTPPPVLFHVKQSADGHARLAWTSCHPPILPTQRLRPTAAPARHHVHTAPYMQPPVPGPRPRPVPLSHCNSHPAFTRPFAAQ